MEKSMLEVGIKPLDEFIEGKCTVALNQPENVSFERMVEL
jgi:hypothetical protein